MHYVIEHGVFFFYNKYRVFIWRGMLMNKRLNETEDVDVMSLPEQFGVGLLEVILLRDDIEYYSELEDSVTFSNYKKAIRDIASMFCGFYELYSKDEFCTRVFQTLYSQSKNYIIRGDLEILLGNMISDGNECVSMIGETDSVQEFTDCIEMVIELLRARKKEAVIRRATLQKRLKQLEELRQEEQELSEAEKLIDLKNKSNACVE